MTEPNSPLTAREGLRAITSSDRFSMAEALGGPRGLAEAALPGVVFVVVYSVVRQLEPAIWAAVGLALGLAVLRLARRESMQQALSGLVGVAVCAFVATRTGRAEDFYLPGLWINAGYAAGYAVSILVRWPLLGLFVGPLFGEGLAWRHDPPRLRAYQLASGIWVAVFLLRLVVQWPLYEAGMVAALGIARVAMGLPLFGLAIYLSWLVLRRVPMSKPAGS